MQASDSTQGGKPGEMRFVARAPQPGPPHLLRDRGLNLSQRRRRFRARRLLRKALTYAVVIALALAFIAPFAFAVSTSLKSAKEIYVFPPRWIPESIQWRNYVYIWQVSPLALFLQNTVVVTALSMIGQVGSSALVGYGFARFRFPGREILFVLVLSTMILPGEVTMIPVYLIFRDLGWLNTWKPLIVPKYFGAAFYVFIFRQFFMTIPRDFDEAAHLDGAGPLQVFWQVILPLSQPALISVALFSFLANWNDFMAPLIYLDTESKFTISLGLRYFQNLPFTGSEAREQYLMAASMVATLPLAIAFLLLQQRFEQGIVLSGIKG